MKQIAVVTGASRGVGRGVAISLSQAGFEVFASGRTIDSAALPEQIHRFRCDHLDDQQTDSMFRQVSSAGGQLAILVNCAWGGYERMVENGNFTWALPFWEQPAHRWESMIEAGVRAAFTCSSRAAKMMLPYGSGLIVNISYWAAQKYLGNVIYGMAKAATDKMSADMAHDLRPHGITAVSLYPGLVRTEAVLESAKQGWLDVTNSESPEFVGFVVAALARDPALATRSGQVLVAAALAAEYGISDIDGKQPQALTLQST